MKVKNLDALVWDSVLESFNVTSKTLQKVNTDLATWVSLYESLHSFVSSIRTQEASTAYGDKAKLMAEDSSYHAEHERAKKRKRLFNEVDSEVELFPSERSFRASTFLPILDSLLTELVRRTDVDFLFTLLHDIFWSGTTWICAQSTFLNWRGVWGWDNSTRWLHKTACYRSCFTPTLFETHSRRRNIWIIAERRHGLQSLIDIARR